MSDSVILWTVVHQDPLFMGFSRKEYWSGLPFPPLGDLPDPGIELASLTSPALAGRFFTTSASWEAYIYIYISPLFLGLFLIGHYRALSRVPCAIR